MALQVYSLLFGTIKKPINKIGIKKALNNQGLKVFFLIA